MTQPDDFGDSPAAQEAIDRAAAAAIDALTATAHRFDHLDPVLATHRLGLALRRTLNHDQLVVVLATLAVRTVRAATPHVEGSP